MKGMLLGSGVFRVLIRKCSEIYFLGIFFYGGWGMGSGVSKY